MPKGKPSRKQLFQAACAIAGVTAEKWGELNGIGPGHLSMILAGTRKNESVVVKIDAFIRKHMAGHTALAS